MLNYSLYVLFASFMGKFEIIIKFVGQVDIFSNILRRERGEIEPLKSPCICAC
jgi:hypothetical protein